MQFMPLMIDIQDKHVVVIGGGPTATRKVKKLLSYGAYITVVSPHVTKDIANLDDEGRLLWKEKQAESHDVTAAFLVVLATDDDSLHHTLKNCVFPTTLVSDVTDIYGSDAYIPACFNQGKLTVSVSTHGASPFLAKKIKQDLAEEFDDSYGEYVDFLHECRMLLKKSSYEKEKRMMIMKSILHEDYHHKGKQAEMLSEIKQHVPNMAEFI